MCGRFGLFHSWAEMHASYSMIGPALNLMPRYNIAPTQAVIAVIRAANGAGREATGFQWGLVPPWAKGPGDRRENDERPVRDGHRKAVLQERFQAPSLPDPGERIF